MICNNCGLNNNDENKFCTNCGVELEKATVSCNMCGADNDSSNTYCVSCGAKIKAAVQQGELRRKKNKRNPSKTIKGKQRSNNYNIEKRLNFKPLIITIGVFVASLAIYTIIDKNINKDNLYKPANFEIKSGNPAVEAKVYEIASKFVCSCGTCGEESLELCTCPRAAEERQFIREYVEKNANSSDIIMALANKYGYLKSEYAKSYNVDKSRVWNTTEIKYPSSPAKGINASAQSATFADINNIYSAFNCPCGQCGIDELKDCNCNHPNGATEVKRFIRDKIAENKYSVDQIIELVDKRYGGKKI
ncbi:double zinc ribbon domain-containing protein [Melioribacter sp. Ez-97]|uniref:double zinc ribbon domain-containing protein n=1 Tax=Melioribacter sp. Ez-97 TaxID=3423434 RepID=UPI003EDAF644